MNKRTHIESIIKKYFGEGYIVKAEVCAQEIMALDDEIEEKCCCEFYHLGRKDQCVCKVHKCNQHPQETSTAGGELDEGLIEAAYRHGGKEGVDYLKETSVGEGWDGTLSVFKGFGRMSEEDRKKARRYIHSLLLKSKEEERLRIVEIIREAKFSEADIMTFTSDSKSFAEYKNKTLEDLISRLS